MDRRMNPACAVGLVLAALAFESFAGAVSESFTAFLRPDESSFWRTAPGKTVTVPVEFPEGATKATLTVAAPGYSRTYTDITTDSYAFDLPEATDPASENVYDLTLTFDDAANTIRTAKLGLVQGLSPDSEGTTRCLAPAGSKVWNKVKGQAVLPIPYGMRTITVNGVDTDTGLDGAQGWYALGKIEPNEAVTLSGVAGGVEYAASLLGGGAGLMMILK